MDSLILRKAAIDALGECPYNWNDWPEEIQAVNDWQDAIESIKNVPAVDAVQVVRCKDCKHWGVVDGCNWMTCMKGILTGWSNKGYGYCNYGERRMENG